ncbi:MAG: endonuclease/exonuclease/phosphatase family protein [Lachnospiraceae bacterium]|nr:endonuclease/exonuclease/phosphatase family protein [Lachnospiraceae bacterium]
MAKAFTVIGIVIAAIIVIALGYFAYVFISYHRIEDHLVIIPYGTTETESLSVGKEMTITSYNIGFGAYSDDYTFFMDGGKESWAFSKEAVYENIDGAMGVIEEQKPDIALFQEVDYDGTRSYHVDEVALVQDAMWELGQYAALFAQNYDSPFLMYPITQPHGANKAGIMTFSKADMFDGIRRSLPIEEGLSKVLDLDRCYSKVRVQVDNGKQLVIYNMHLSAYTSKAETAETQLSMVVQDMQEEYDKGNYCIAGGDFNRDLLGNSPEIFHTAVLEDNWAQPVNMSLFTDDITLVAPFQEADMIASCRNPDKPYEEGDFVVTVDGFIVSANVEVTYANVIDAGFKYSDHNPVIMKFKLK